MKFLPKDDYPTPPWCYKMLEPVINWDRVKTFLEPCAGDYRIYNWVETEKKYFAEIKNGLDYFNDFNHSPYDLIITNPPYSKMLQFVEKGVKESQCSFWLLPLSFLASQERKHFWRVRPCTTLIPLSKRPSFSLDGRTDSVDYGWFVWDYAGICKVTGIVHLPYEKELEDYERTKLSLKATVI